MLNQCQFIGNLGRDPEIRTTQSGDKVANLRIACTEKWKDKNSGERREKTEWVSVVIFGPTAAVAEGYLHKGSKVYISGKLQTRKWQDQEGNDRYSTEVVLSGWDSKLVMLDGPREHQPRNEESTQQTRSHRPEEEYGPHAGDLDDEIPF